MLLDIQDLLQNWSAVVKDFQQNPVTSIAVLVVLVCLISAFFIFMHMFLTWLHQKAHRE